MKGATVLNVPKKIATHSAYPLNKGTVAKQNAAAYGSSFARINTVDVSPSIKFDPKSSIRTGIDTASTINPPKMSTPTATTAKTSETKYIPLIAVKALNMSLRPQGLQEEKVKLKV